MQEKVEARSIQRLERRAFLKSGASAAVATLIVAQVLQPPAVESTSGTGKRKFYDNFPKFSKGQMTTRWAMVVDLNKCIGCQACTASCKAEFNVPVGVFRTWVREFEDGNYPNVKVEFLPSLCNHCDEPPCVPICPVQAIYKREDGAVLIDSEKCIGCGYCVQACPYNAAFINPLTQVAEKCTFCTNRVEQGLAPACVETCVGGARIFGDLADPQSKVSELVSTKPVQVLKPELGTEPMVYYIGLDKNIVGRPREESA